MSEAERELLARVKGGDESAQAQFYEAHRLRLYRTCVHFLGSQDPDAEDIVQETFLSALRDLHQFDFRQGIYAWLNKICVNLCFKRLKKRQRLVMTLDGELDAISRPFALENHREEGQARQKAEAVALVRSFWPALGTSCRQILELRDAEARSYTEIASSIRAPLGTVFSRLARCRQKLKELLEKELGVRR